MNEWYTIPENEKSLDDALVQLCYERIAGSIPQGINRKEALKAEFKVFQKVFNSNE